MVKVLFSLGVNTIPSDSQILIETVLTKVVDAVAENEIVFIIKNITTAQQLVLVRFKGGIEGEGHWTTVKILIYIYLY